MSIIHDVPHTYDGKQIILNNAFPDGVNIVFAGAASGAGKWDGSPFRYKCTQALPGTYECLKWSYKDWIYLAGGEIRYSGAVFGDEINFYVSAPATLLTTGSGYSLSPTGLGFNIVTPGTTHDIDLSNDAIPVPNTNKMGFFDWDPDTNIISLNASRKGGYDLYDADILLSNYLARKQIFGGTDSSPSISNFIIPAIRPKRILPQWSCKVSYTSSSDKSASPFRIAWELFAALEKTA